MSRSSTGADASDESGDEDDGAAQCAARVREAPIVERSEQEPIEAQRTSGDEDHVARMRRMSAVR